VIKKKVKLKIVRGYTTTSSRRSTRRRVQGRKGGGALKP
jgi:hypothetical protein